MGVLVEDLLESIKLRSLAPISQSTFEDSGLLLLANEELKSYIVPKIIKTREDFFLTYQDTAFQVDRSVYALNERAVGNSLKTLYYVNSDLKEEHRLEKTDLNKIDFFATSGTPHSFYMRGDKIIIVPKPAVAEGYLRQYFFRKQSQLVETDDVTKITAVSVGASQTTFTVDTDLSSSLSATDLVDFQNAQSPFLSWADDVEIQSITASTVVVNNADIQDGASNTLPGIGDYICAAKQSNIPQIPEEFHPVLAQRCAVKLLEALNDRRKWEIAKADLKDMEAEAGLLIRNRVESSPKKINPRNSLATALSCSGGV